MLYLKRTDSADTDFLELVSALDRDLRRRDGAEQNDYYARFNKVNAIRHVVVAYEGSVPVGCGAIKAFDDDAMEVKRMWVNPQHRGKGIARSVLAELEKWARELGSRRCVLETGQKQPEALGLYRTSGYQVIPNYGQYVGVANSVCFEKGL